MFERKERERSVSFVWPTVQDRFADTVLRVGYEYLDSGHEAWPGRVPLGDDKFLVMEFGVQNRKKAVAAVKKVTRAMFIDLGYKIVEDSDRRLNMRLDGEERAQNTQTYLASWIHHRRGFAIFRGDDAKYAWVQDRDLPMALARDESLRGEEGKENMVVGVDGIQVTRGKVVEVLGAILKHHDYQFSGVAEEDWHYAASFKMKRDLVVRS